ncbi:hypothetical protein GGS20DRAFT_546595 [Poronia punctata]|nr:hypothetical protein GGS20DRAFT_546595 [Poronia punctata]
MSDATPKTQASRIAIKFGAPGTKTPNHEPKRRGQAHPSTLGKRQRPNALDDDSASGEEENTAGKYQAITTIGYDTTTSKNNDLPVAKKRNKEFVIGSIQNRDWRADAKAKRGNKAAPSYASPAKGDHGVETAPADEDKDVKWGLIVTKRKSTPGTSATPDDRGLEECQGDVPNKTTTPTLSSGDADKEALDALLGNRNPAQDLVINHSATKDRPQLSEEDAYRKSLQEAAEVSTVEEYSGIPEGEFGAAMLRGMGWKGEEFGSKPKEVKRRPQLMGLGSKEDEEIKKAELAKRHGHRERRPRLDEYRRDREKERHERDGRHRESYKSERDRERREEGQDYRSKDRYRDHNHHSHRSRR